MHCRSPQKSPSGVPKWVLELLEIITPGELEQAFGDMDEELDPEALAEMVGGYGREVDCDGTMPIVQPHGLVFYLRQSVDPAKLPVSAVCAGSSEEHDTL